jgi:hypothetical protein
VSLATATLFKLGIAEPRRHIFVAGSGHIATLIVSRTPLSAGDIARLDGVADEKRYQILLSPDRPPASPVLGEIIGSENARDLQRVTANLLLDLTPPTDERPFFFNQLPLSDPWRTLQVALNIRDTGVLSGNITATFTLVALFIASLMVVIRTIVYPLHPAIADVGKRLATGGTAYFLLIGAGFMCAEIGLLQRLTVFLGHPIYSLTSCCSR